MVLTAQIYCLHERVFQRKMLSEVVNILAYDMADMR